ncbi:MAG TPA: hypothetical protein VEB68_00930 [Croceibacterium sp.]|nr:hypothetical protein [Croceibacterium sp.]
MDEFSPTATQTARPPRRTGWRLVVGAVIAAFGLGSAATWYLTRPDDYSLSEALQLGSQEPSPRTAASAPVSTPLPDATGRVAQAAEQQGGIDQRVAAMEQRLAQLDLQSQAAAGNAARSEGLLIAFAARRSLERGTRLGYLEDQLRLRFGDARPNAVQTVIDAARDPVTLDQLLARLDGLAPELTVAPDGESALDWLSRELSSLFVVRREDAPSPAPERRTERARLFLESGRVEAAISEVRNLPNAEQAREWIADAGRYAAAQRALETLETAAILEPRELRDGEGDPVEQPSPAAER